MKERPILFSAPMVRALLAGTKTQTRRAVKRIHSSFDENRPMHCPYGLIGDRLWVRETYWPNDSEPELFAYRADGEMPDHMKGTKWKSPIFMPRVASRITLEITEVRVQRLQEISEADAVAEGVVDSGGVILDHWYKTGEIKTGYSSLDCGTFPTAVVGYEFLWNALNRKTHPWSDNPYVWALTFRRVDA